MITDIRAWQKMEYNQQTAELRKEINLLNKEISAMEKTNEAQKQQITTAEKTVESQERQIKMLQEKLAEATGSYETSAEAESLANNNEERS